MTKPLDDSIVPTARPRSLLPWVVVGLLILTTVAVLAGPGTTVAWQTIHANLDAWRTWTDQNLFVALVIYFAVYAVCASLPLPLLSVLTLLGGCLFGRWLGTGVAGLGYVSGVTIAFLVARSLFRDRLRRRFGPRLLSIEAGFARDGAFYLLALRLMPGVPFFLVTWLMALTPIRTSTFSAVSWVGTLPLTFLTASVGTELALTQTPAEVLSWPLLTTLAALAVVPLLLPKVMRAFSRRQ